MNAGGTGKASPNILPGVYLFGKPPQYLTFVLWSSYLDRNDAIGLVMHLKGLVAGLPEQSGELTGNAHRHFLQRAQCSHCKIASAVLATAIPSVRPSVRPSVCLSHAGIVSKRRHVARCSFHRWIAKCV